MFKAFAAFGSFATLALQAYGTPGSNNTELEKSLPLMDGDAFAFTIDAENEVATHQLSGLECPFSLDDHFLIRIAQYSVVGHDVGCTYQTHGATSVLSFYFSRYGDASTPDKILENALEQMERADRTGELLEEGPLPLQLGRSSLSGCQHVILNQGTNKPGQKTSVIGCNIDGWAFKVRATWSVPDHEMRDAISRFTSIQTATREKLEACRSSRSTNRPPAQMLPASPEVALAVLVGLAAETQTNAPPSPQTNLINDETCYVMHSTDDGSALLLMGSTGRGPTAWQAIDASIDSLSYSPYLAIRQEDSDILSLVGSNELETDADEVWSLSGGPHSQITAVYGVYRGRPTMDQAIADMNAVMDGSLNSLGSIERLQDGNTNIKLSVD